MPPELTASQRDRLLILLGMLLATCIQFGDKELEEIVHGLIRKLAPDCKYPMEPA